MVYLTTPEINDILVKENKKRIKQAIGKTSRKQGKAFELKVRKDLEKSGWIVCKWANNVELQDNNSLEVSGKFNGQYGKLISAKHTFNPFTRAMSAGNGFPDFIAYRNTNSGFDAVGKLDNGEVKNLELHIVLGIESKMDGKLDKLEKEKCKWLLDNKIFGRILVASKGTKRGEIKYEEFK